MAKNRTIQLIVSLVAFVFLFRNSEAREKRVDDLFGFNLGYTITFKEF
jgi:hypothetical protein